MKKYLILSLIMFATGAFADVGSKTLGDLADGWSTQLPGIGDLTSAIAYVAGVGFGVMTALKLKEANEQKKSITPAIIYFICCALCVTLPSYIGSGVESVFGKGTTQNQTYNY